MTFSFLATWFRSLGSSLSKMAQPCERSRHKSRWISSWWKPIVRISRPFRFAANVANLRIRESLLNRSQTHAELLSKKLLAPRPQPRKSSSDSTARKDRHEQDRHLHSSNPFVDGRDSHRLVCCARHATPRRH